MPPAVSPSADSTGLVWWFESNWYASPLGWASPTTRRLFVTFSVPEASPRSWPTLAVTTASPMPDGSIASTAPP